MQVYLHGKAFPTPCVCTAKGSLPLVVSMHVTLQVEVLSELFLAARLGAQELFLLPRMDTQLMPAQEPGVIKQLFALATRHLGCRNRILQLKAGLNI